MTSKVVVGKRVPERKGLPVGLAWYGVAIVLVVFSVRNFIEGDTPWGAVFAVAGVVVALIGKTLTGDEKRTSEIVSACPVCGVECQRSFMVLRQERDPYDPCGACIAYLRLDLDTLEVKEEAAEATGGHYWVDPAQYVAVVPRSDGRFKFEVPTMCAVCGAAEAPLLRTLDPMTDADAGILGAVASGVASEVAVDTGFAKANRRYDSNTLTSGDELDLQLRGVEMHVCTKHASIIDRACQYKAGALSFSSYRHYKAFCELNNITATAAS